VRCKQSTRRPDRGAKPLTRHHQAAAELPAAGGPGRQRSRQQGLIGGSAPREHALPRAPALHLPPVVRHPPRAALPQPLRRLRPTQGSVWQRRACFGSGCGAACARGGADAVPADRATARRSRPAPACAAEEYCAPQLGLECRQNNVVQYACPSGATSPRACRALVRAWPLLR
jgi:hypothetical protein